MKQRSNQNNTLFAALLGAAALWLSVPSARAADLVVDTAADRIDVNGDCSLREAVLAANLDQPVDRCPAGDGADTIRFSPALGDRVLRLTLQTGAPDESGDLDVHDDLTVIGNGHGVTVIDGHVRDRIWDVHASAHLSLEGLTLQHGAADLGGALRARQSATVTLRHCVVRDSTAWQGGAIAASDEGTLSLTDVTLARSSATRGGALYAADAATTSVRRTTLVDNAAHGDGGAIYLGGDAVATIESSTLARNHSGSRGGAVRNEAELLRLLGSTLAQNSAGIDGGALSTWFGRATTEVQNSILAGNEAPSAPNCDSSATSLGHNVVDVTRGCGNGLHTSDQAGDAGLADFHDNDTPGRGHYPLLPDSPARGAADSSTCVGTDQLQNIRASTRATAACDVGAVEYVSVAACVDEDGDGFGAPGSPLCPSGPTNDCDDNDPQVNPDATETCNGRDDDCDGVTPREELDEDGDGARTCEDDCDDQDSQVGPNHAEVYDGRDNDCDGDVDEGTDDDGDGIPNFVDACPDTASGSGVDREGCAVCGGLPDADDDGETDATDACPGTPVGVEVDAAGCSQQQFCNAIDTDELSGRKACHAADWKNDEPVQSLTSPDCRVVAGSCATTVLGGPSKQRRIVGRAWRNGRFVPVWRYTQ